MVEQLILGMAQGIVEWLPVSSEGVIVLIKTIFFHHEGPLDLVIKEALFLHLGTFFAALIYFRKDVVHLIKKLITYRSAEAQTKIILNFLIISTLISGALGYALLQLIENVKNVKIDAVTGKVVAASVALLLLITAVLQFTQKRGTHQRSSADLKNKDSFILGVVQGFAALPGLSRSGLTVSALLLRNVDKTDALKLSFLMSLPVVLAGNIILNLDGLFFNFNALVGLAASFVFGFLTIDILLKFARKVNFGYFLLFFAFVTFLSAL